MTRNLKRGLLYDKDSHAQISECINAIPTVWNDTAGIKSIPIYKRRNVKIAAKRQPHLISHILYLISHNCPLFPAQDEKPPCGKIRRAAF